MTRRVRRWTARSLTLAIASSVAAAACGGNGGGTAPVPCSTYSGGVISGALPGNYNLTSICQGMKPDLVPPAATGTVTITATDFTASITIGGVTTPISGTYTTSPPDGITVTLAGGLGQFVGNYRVTTTTLEVSGTVATQSLSFVGTRVP